MTFEENYENQDSNAVWLRKLPFNEKGRDFVVGDIHGCLDELIALLAHAKFNPKRDRLLSVGDIIDRGPKSEDALSLLEKPWFIAVRGNHEQMLLDHWTAPHENPAYDPDWLRNIHQDSISYYKTLINQLPYVLKIGEGTDSFYLMHAELWDTSFLLDNAMIDQFLFLDPKQTLAKVLWSRHIISNHNQHPIEFHHPNLSRIFCGHTIVQSPTMIGKSIYIDTGAFAPYIDKNNAQTEHYGLSLIEVKTLRHWFAPTCQQYRGSIVDMGRINELKSAPLISFDNSNQNQPDSSLKD